MIPVTKNIRVLLVSLFGLALFSITQNASAQEAVPTEPDSGAVVCPQGNYPLPPDDCLPLGPSQIITEMANMGITYPIQPLPAVKPPSDLGYVPYLYYRITEYTSNYYPSLEAAMEKQGALRQIGPGELIYLTYTNVAETNRGTYFQTASGEWFPGDGTRVSVPNIFQGLEFLATPKNSFGWILFETDIRPEPFYNFSAPAVRKAPRSELVQIYQTVLIEGTEWHLIGPNEWVEGRWVGMVQPKTTPPDGVTNGRWIDINLAEQTLAVYDNNEMVFATLIASGVEPFWTRPGLFQIYLKKQTEDMSGAFEADRSDYYYLQNVPYTMYFDKARAIHGAYWRTFMGYEQSHGCVNMSIADAAWLFNWAQEGDWVHVHDPSGRTPTDPAVYGDGGA